MDNKNIKDYDALVRRANKIASDFDRYPLMPQGDHTIEFIEKVFDFNPLFVLDELKKHLMDTLLEVTEYKYSEEELQPIVEEAYTKHETEQKERILKTVIENYRSEVRNYIFRHSWYVFLRPEETVVFYYAFSIFYIARDLHKGPALLYARQALKTVELFHCEKDTTPLRDIKHSGKMLSLSEFKRDYAVYDKLINMIEEEIEKLPDKNIKRKLDEQKKEERKSAKGCYVATCVYGSYDCPQVWILRRFRDNVLSKYCLGRLFIKSYYAISPTIVKKFSECNWFIYVCKSVLDKIVIRLQSKGFENTPYDDKF